MNNPIALNLTFVYIQDINILSPSLWPHTPFPQVKVLYVRNLHIDTQENTIAEVFQKIAPVERVKKIRDYAFVHFSTKEDARKAKNSIDKTKIDGCEVEVC